MKTQQRFKSEKHNVFTEKINKIAFSSNDDKIMQAIDLIEICAYGTSKDLVGDEEEIKCSKIIKKMNDKKMVNLDDVTKENIKEIIQINHKFLIIHIKY